MEGGLGELAVCEGEGKAGETVAATLYIESYRTTAPTQLDHIDWGLTGGEPPASKSRRNANGGGGQVNYVV